MILPGTENEPRRRLVVTPGNLPWEVELIADPAGRTALWLQVHFKHRFPLPVLARGQRSREELPWATS